MMIYKYIEKNSGDICAMFLHGWGQNSASLKNIYDNVRLSVIAVDIAESVPSTYDIYSYALDIFELISKLNYKKYILVGHSFGGRLAIILSALCDINISKIILIDSAGIIPRRTLRYRLNVTFYKVLKALHITANLGSSDYRNLSPDTKKVFVRIVNEDLRYLLPKIENKTTIFWGKDDIDTPIYMAKIFKNDIRHSKLVTFSGGHFAYNLHSHMIAKTIEDNL